MSSKEGPVSGHMLLVRPTGPPDQAKRAPCQAKGPHIRPRGLQIIPNDPSLSKVGFVSGQGGPRSAQGAPFQAKRAPYQAKGFFVGPNKAKGGPRSG